MFTKGRQHSRCEARTLSLGRYTARTVCVDGDLSRMRHGSSADASLGGAVMEHCEPDLLSKHSAGRRRIYDQGRAGLFASVRAPCPARIIHEGRSSPAGPECKKGHTNPQARLGTYGPAGPSELVKGQHTQQYASVDADEHADAQREREGPHRVSSIRCRCHRVYRSLATGSRMVAVPDRPSSRSQ